MNDAEAKQFLDEYEAAKGDLSVQAVLQRKLGYKSYNSVRDYASGLRRQLEDVPDDDTRVIYKAYPKLSIKPFPLEVGQRDEEDFNLVIADTHADKITPSYNKGIFKTRMEKLLADSMIIMNLHRPIRNVNIFILGDVIQGENTFQGSRGDSISQSAFNQIHTLAVPVFVHFLVTIKQGCKQVKVFAVKGNHGRYGREALDTTNWDLFFYQALQSSLERNQANDISVTYSDTFSMLINIKGFRFFIIHGDQCKGNAAVPVIAMRRKMQEWYASVGGFHYAYAGHFHSEYQDRVNSIADYTIAPPLVTGDTWAVEKIGRISQPQQLCFGVHSKYGRTFRYTLHTDDKFLPQKYDEPEGVIK